MDKELLFKPRLTEEDIDIAGVGTVRVRGLTRREAIEVRKATDTQDNLDGPRLLVIERKMIAAGMVEPKLTEDEVARWQEASAAGELDEVANVISRLSGMLEGAPKAAYKSARRRS